VTSIAKFTRKVSAQTATTKAAKYDQQPPALMLVFYRTTPKVNAATAISWTTTPPEKIKKQKKTTSPQYNKTEIFNNSFSKTLLFFYTFVPLNFPYFPSLNVYILSRLCYI